MRPTTTTIRVSEKEYERLSNANNHRTVIVRKTNDSNHDKLIQTIYNSDASVKEIKPQMYKMISFVCGDKQVTRRCFSVHMSGCEDEYSYQHNGVSYWSNEVRYYLHEIVNL